ncbi:MAG: stage II sporulation protein R [Clostridia bacterium]|nr:stage II sporulation protein R [Clostridia bacterium]
MKHITAFAASILIAAAVLSVLPVYGETEIYDDVLRLHVIAESDSDADQAMKLKVRDAVLDCLAAEMDDCVTVEDALATAQDMLDEVETAAERCLDENGSDCTVSVSLGREQYPRRDYGASVMPAGTYHSLRVTIGEGEGKNWWCVLFPTVCVRFAEADEDTYIAAGFTPEEYRIITGSAGKLRVRFRVLEILSELVGFGY